MRQFWPLGHKTKWDMHVMAQHLDDLGYPHTDDPSEGAVVVVPAGDIKPRHLNDILEGMPWAVVIGTSDERSSFEWHRVERLHDPRVKFWISTPHPERHADIPARFFGEGYPDGTLALLAPHDDDAKPTDVFFAGQNTHARRAGCIAAACDLDGLEVKVVETPGFLQGLDRSDYLADMARSKIALCPAGSDTPDSFRAYEALAAGCVPILDGRTSHPDFPPGYWDLVAPGAPMPVIGEWHDLGKTVEAILADWEQIAAECRGWWLRRLRDERAWIEEDVRAASTP